MPSSFLKTSKVEENSLHSLRFLGLFPPKSIICSATTLAGREERTITLSERAMASEMSWVTKSAVFFEPRLVVERRKGFV